MPKADLKLLEEIFRAKVLAMLKAEGMIGDETICKLLSWRRSSMWKRPVTSLFSPLPPPDSVFVNLPQIPRLNAEVPLKG
jgi:hypothetical protein